MPHRLSFLLLLLLSINTTLNAQQPTASKIRRYDAEDEVLTKNRAAVKRRDLYPKLQTKYAFGVLSYSASRL